MHAKFHELSSISGISYTVFRKGEKAPWQAVVWPTDDTYTHRDFLLEQKQKDGLKFGDFSSCGILLYDGNLKKWFPIFCTSYQTKHTKTDDKRDLILAIRAAQKEYANNTPLMDHLIKLAEEKIINQRNELKKIGLDDQRIDAIILKNAALRKNCY